MAAFRPKQIWSPIANPYLGLTWPDPIQPGQIHTRQHKISRSPRKRKEISILWNLLEAHLHTITSTSMQTTCTPHGRINTTPQHTCMLHAESCKDGVWSFLSVNKNSHMSIQLPLFALSLPLPNRGRKISITAYVQPATVNKHTLKSQTSIFLESRH